MAKKEADAKYIKKLFKIEEKHLKKYPNKKMSIRDFNGLCGQNNVLF